VEETLLQKFENAAAK